jgi:hypothetical protein
MLTRDNMKRFFAGFLLALFVFIQAEKNLHEHQQTAKCDLGQNVASIENSSYCFICDFQLAADTDIPVNDGESFSASFNLDDNVASVSLFLQDPIFFFSGRGPPNKLPAVI